MYKGYKGIKITKRLQRYIGYAKTKYEKLSMIGEVDLWEIMNEYEMIAGQLKCVQQYIYDWITGSNDYAEEYTMLNSIDGGVYVKKREQVA